MENEDTVLVFIRYNRKGFVDPMSEELFKEIKRIILRRGICLMEDGYITEIQKIIPKFIPAY